VALLLENSCEKVGTCTSFHPDQAGGHVHGEGDQLLPAKALLDDDLAFLAQPNQVKTVLPKSIPQTCAFMRTPLSWLLAFHKSLWKATDHSSITAAPAK